MRRAPSRTFWRRWILVSRQHKCVCSRAAYGRWHDQLGQSGLLDMYQAGVRRLPQATLGCTPASPARRSHGREQRTPAPPALVLCRSPIEQASLGRRWYFMAGMAGSHRSKNRFSGWSRSQPWPRSAAAAYDACAPAFQQLLERSVKGEGQLSFVLALFDFSIREIAR